jgi:hypothetical protein
VLVLSIMMMSMLHDQVPFSFESHESRDRSLSRVAHSIVQPFSVHTGGLNKQHQQQQQQQHHQHRAWSCGKKWHTLSSRYFPLSSTQFLTCFHRHADLNLERRIVRRSLSLSLSSFKVLDSSNSSSDHHSLHSVVVVSNNLDLSSLYTKWCSAQ